MILIVTDDQGWGDFGVHGNSVVRTPNLDRMAGESARLVNFYVHPVCTPTRAALMTGRAPQRTRAFDTWIGRAMMDPEELTLAERLSSAGFATGIFGKWHLGDCYPMRPMEQGFDESLVLRGGGIGQPADPIGGEGKYTDPVLFHNGERVEVRGYCTDVYFEAAMGWMREQVEGEQPFFVYLPTNAPHGPFHDVPEELYQEYVAADLAPAAFPASTGHALPEQHDEDRLARIFAMITNIDENVGRLFEQLEELGIAEDTLVLYLNDNGPNTRRWNGGMRGMKTQVYEGGVRSPLWARWPAQLEAGTVSERVASDMDVMPTVLEACGVAPDPDVKLDGRSFLSLLEGTEQGWSDRQVTLQSHRGNEAVRYHNFFSRTQRWKLLNATGFGRDVPEVEPAFELYDMQADPLELHDVAAANPEVVAEMRAEYDRWFDDVGSTRLDNYAPPRIVLAALAPETHLTRQDWRRTRGDGWGARKTQGEWAVRVDGESNYQVRVIFPKGTSPTRVTLVLGQQSWTSEVQLSPGGRSFSFAEDLRLPVGEAALRVDLEQEGDIFGPYQVILRRSTSD